jgi:hypothetical protein
MTERDRVRKLVRFRDAVVNLISVSGGMAFKKYREACEDVLAMALGRRPTDSSSATRWFLNDRSRSKTSPSRVFGSCDPKRLCPPHFRRASPPLFWGADGPSPHPLRSQRRRVDPGPNPILIRPRPPQGARAS